MAGETRSTMSCSGWHTAHVTACSVTTCWFHGYRRYCQARRAQAPSSAGCSPRRMLQTCPPLNRPKGPRLIYNNLPDPPTQKALPPNKSIYVYFPPPSSVAEVCDMTEVQNRLETSASLGKQADWLTASSRTGNSVSCEDSDASCTPGGAVTTTLLARV